MADTQLTTSQRNGNNVEANVVQPVMGENVVFGGFHHEPGLGIGHKLFRISVAEVTAGFDLYENQNLPFSGYEINFGVLVTVISGHNFIAFVLQIANCFGFSLLAGFVVLGH